MIGYGLTGNPHGEVANMINHVNDSGRKVLALDVPSGLDSTSGTPGNPCIRATATLTLALPKTGFITSDALAYVGKLYLADISVPPQLYSLLGIEIPPIFNKHTIVEITEGLDESHESLQ